MRALTLILTLGILAILSTAAAEPVRTQVTNPATAQDSAPNSDAVPDAYALAGQFDRILVIRLKNQADLLDGLERMTKQQNIRNAVILAGIGSVRGYHIHTVSNSFFPTQNVFVKDPTSPADIASMNGYIIDGRVHAHITLANGEKAFGGHLESATNVFTFAVVTVGVFKDGIDLSRVDDKNYR
jgi:predicted DNA-binding protein with PD1-like motif